MSWLAVVFIVVSVPHLVCMVCLAYRAWVVQPAGTREEMKHRDAIEVTFVSFLVAHVAFGWAAVAWVDAAMHVADGAGVALACFAFVMVHAIFVLGDIVFYAWAVDRRPTESEDRAESAAAP